jgi:L-aspartate oxidase
MTLCSDFLVIGSGIAGLRFAIEAARSGSVIVVTKKKDTESNTNYAQGGIACVADPSDSFERHIDDTLRTGRGLCHDDAVELLVSEGPERLRELIAWGVEFTTSNRSRAMNKLDLGREGGHSVNRIVHARDLTGKEIENALLAKAKSASTITLLEDHCLVELITQHHLRGVHGNSCFGAYVLNTRTRAIEPIIARQTCLATGGAGRVYLHTSNPAIATGDGVATAYRAGATIANMEFIQFHPTTLYHTKGDSFLISEALRGYGAVLRNSRGEEYMARYHSMKSLAPRDIVAQATDHEIKISGQPYVYLDIRHQPASRTRRKFPNISARCRSLGIDITKDLIPVVPAAHYICGGILVDLDGRSSISHLYACGEAACTGVHGANRLASNSLLEALVFAHRAAQRAARELVSAPRINVRRAPCWDDSGTSDNEEWVLLSHNFNELRSIMWDYVGIVRSTLRLRRAMRRIRLLEKETEDFYRRTKITEQLLELRNLVTVAKLVSLCAQKRKESRGLHYTTDYPGTNDRFWKRDTIIQNVLSR